MIPEKIIFDAVFYQLEQDVDYSDVEHEIVRRYNAYADQQAVIAKLAEACRKAKAYYMHFDDATLENIHEALALVPEGR
jgi:hypothetical protein